MENNELLQPLKYYESSGKSAHAQNVEDYFNELLKKSEVDPDANRKHVKAYNKQVKVVENINAKISRQKILRGFLIFLTVIGFICAGVGIFDLATDKKFGMLVTVLLISIGLVLAISMLVIIFVVINKKLRHYRQEYDAEKQKELELLDICKADVAPLISLFTERDTFNVIEKTLPQIKFNQCYDHAIDEDFHKNYNFIDLMNENRSVVDTVSGRIYGNPFVFYRYRNHYMGSKTYNGELIIHWTTVESDGDGGTRTVHHTQTLFASVVKPYPCYDYGTALNYGCQSGPDLNFSREQHHYEEMSDAKIEKLVNRGEKQLQRKAEKATQKGGTFTEMTNSKFDVLFGADDRDQEVQFRMLFSPLAQTNMVDLLRSKTGYGDDFRFTKRGKFNLIESEHQQNWNMNTSPVNYHSHDIDVIKQKFTDFNNNYFKSVYFDFAPLMAIPTYHQEPSMTFEPLDSEVGNYAYYEHEALANAIGASNFQHPETASEVILKARCINSVNNTDCVQVKAESYSATNRVDYVPVYGGDGKYHPVPVPWVEYNPIEEYTNIAVKSLGMSRRKFVESTENSDEFESVFSAPSAYLHGLYARIIGDEDIASVDKVLDKIK